MKRLTFALLFAASLASAQTPLTYTAPAGTVHCRNRVGTPAAVNHGCIIGGLVGATGTQTGEFESQVTSTVYVVFRICPGIPPYCEGVIGDGLWAPVVYPPAGVPVQFTLDATISQTCLEECSGASGTFHLDGQWAWQYLTIIYPTRTGGTHITYQDWVNTTDVVVTIVDQSTVAILD